MARALLFDRAYLLTMSWKLFRIVLSVIALNATAILFKQWLLQADASNSPRMPTMIQFVYFFFAIDAFCNVTVSMFMLALVDDDVAKASFVDYLIGTLISMYLSASVAGILSDPSRFEFTRSIDGSLLLVTTLESIIRTFVVTNMFLPYYLFLRDVLY